MSLQNYGAQVVQVAEEKQVAISSCQARRQVEVARGTRGRKCLDSYSCATDKKKKACPEAHYVITVITVEDWSRAEARRFQFWQKTLPKNLRDDFKGET